MFIFLFLGPSIRHFDLVDAKFPEFGEFFIVICAWIEGWTIMNKWEPRSVTRDLKRQARLRDDVDAGDYGKQKLLRSIDVVIGVLA